MRDLVPAGWASALAPALEAPAFAELTRFVEAERATSTVLPAHEHVFAALAATPLEAVRVVLVGQDPYPTPGHAHGLALSVLPGVAPPPSLANMFKELHTDVGFRVPDNGYLMPWAEQGMLLLNTVLTVRAGAAGSHARRGWEAFTDAVIGAVSARVRPAVFALWGTHARKKARIVDAARHRVLEGVHPSPLSAHQGFFGSKPFSRIDAALRDFGERPMVWQLGELGVPVVRPSRSRPLVPPGSPR
ncbi:MAG: uracil-DNA glycosylase [Polyangiaceae bacterium]